MTELVVQTIGPTISAKVTEPEVRLRWPFEFPQESRLHRILEVLLNRAVITPEQRTKLESDLAVTGSDNSGFPLALVDLIAAVPDDAHDLLPLLEAIKTLWECNYFVVMKACRYKTRCIEVEVLWGYPRSR